MSSNATLFQGTALINCSSYKTQCSKSHSLITVSISKDFLPLQWQELFERLEQSVLIKLLCIKWAKLLMLSIKFFEYFFDEVLSPPSLCVMRHIHLAGFPLEIQMSPLLCHYNIDSIMSIMPISGSCRCNSHLPTIKINNFYFYC